MAVYLQCFGGFSRLSYIIILPIDHMGYTIIVLSGVWDVGSKITPKFMSYNVRRARVFLSPFHQSIEERCDVIVYFFILHG